MIFLAGSASAEVIADVALCPLEAVKVRVQTQPGFARGMADGFPKFVKSEGAMGYCFLLSSYPSSSTFMHELTFFCINLKFYSIWQIAQGTRPTLGSTDSM